MVAVKNKTITAKGVVSGRRSCGQDPLKYLTNDGLDVRGTDAPKHISQINKLENQKKKLAINVFSWDKGVIVYRLSKQHKAVPRTNLLLLQKATPG